MKRTCGVALFLSFFFGLLSHAQDASRIRIQTIELGENVYMLTSRAGGNLAVCAGADGIFLVDSEYAQLFDKVRDAVKAISEEPVRYLFNTHWHFDHVGGNEAFAGEGALIVSHDNVRMRLSTDQRIGLLDTEVPALPKAAWPVVTFSDAMTFNLNGEEIAVFHPRNAHTDGDGILHFKKANVIHTGDIFFNGGYPFIDVTNGGSIDGMIAAVEAILERCDGDTKIIPGHGPLASRTDLEAYGKMLREFRDIVAGEMKAGKDLEAILAAKPTAKLDEKWGNFAFPPDKFTEIVYRSLIKE